MTTKDASTRLRTDAFRKILELEESKGFKDTAVIGGLDRFLQIHASSLTLEPEVPEVSELLGTPYASLTPPQRKDWVSRWLGRLEGGVQPEVRPEAASEDIAAPYTTSTFGPQRQQTGALPSEAADVKLSPEIGVTTPRRLTALGGVTLDSPVDRLRGVDTKFSAKLRRLEVSTIRDLLYLLPRRHNDFSQVAKISELVPGEDRTIVATVWEARETKLGRGGLKATEAVVSDESGNIKVVWFGQPYLARLLKPNSRVAISGRVEIYRNQVQFQSPEFEILDRRESLIHTSRLVPVYPLTEGLTPRRLRGIVWQALEGWGAGIEEFLPENTRKVVGLRSLPEAIMQAHYPDDFQALSDARKRLAFDELYLLQMAVLMRRRSWSESVEGTPVRGGPELLGTFRASLPFTLTTAQERCIREVLSDMERGSPPMNRLLQGEVGSGKTVVALAALLSVVGEGHQGSIMVPTEVLAEQHFGTVARLLGGLARPVQEENLLTVHLDPLSSPVSVGLLTGGTRAAVKRELQRRVSEGTLDIIIGTHALIQEAVEIPRLALAVVDEQHRFGVMQRAALRQRGGVSPHVLVMSATPIPRTLTLTLYGDLDISTIDELPSGRRQVLTRQVPSERRDAAYGFVRKEVIDGRQAFIICPLIDESEAIEARAATEEYDRLSKEVFPELRIGLLHGRMASRDKEKVMGKFRDGELDILVSTAVVEVGIDVPNATVMLVEGAHRFGLSQLHQFRGRVGRGEHKSYCLLLSEYSTPEAKERLSAVERINDGFELAEVDLELRGPGDTFGTRQSGLPTLKVARLSDHELLKAARDEAAALLEADPGLQDPAHAPLATEVSRFLDRVRDEVS